MNDGSLAPFVCCDLLRNHSERLHAFKLSHLWALILPHYSIEMSAGKKGEKKRMERNTSFERLTEFYENCITRVLWYAVACSHSQRRPVLTAAVCTYTFSPCRFCLTFSFIPHYFGRVAIDATARLLHQTSNDSY